MRMRESSMKWLWPAQKTIPGGVAFGSPCLPRLLACMSLFVFLLAAPTLAVEGRRIGFHKGWNPSSEITPEAKVALEQGLAAAESGDWVSAVEKFMEARKESPAAPEVLFNLALACDRSGNRRIESIIWFKAYLAALYDEGEASSIRSRIDGLTLEVTGKVRDLLDLALKEASPIIHEKRSIQETAHNFCYEKVVEVYSALGDMAQAEKVAQLIENPYRDHPDPLVVEGFESTLGRYLPLVGGYARKGNFTKALMWLNRIGESYIRGEALLDLAVEMLKAGYREGAAEHATKAKGLIGKTEPMKVLRILADAGKFEKVRSLLGEFEAQYHPRVYRELAVMHARVGNDDAALAALENIPINTKAWPWQYDRSGNNRQDAMYRIVQIWIESRKLDRARGLISRMQELENLGEGGERTTGWSLLKEAELYLMLGEYEEAFRIRENNKFYRNSHYALLMSFTRSLGKMRSCEIIDWSLLGLNMVNRIERAYEAGGGYPSLDAENQERFVESSRLSKIAAAYVQWLNEIEDKESYWASQTGERYFGVHTAYARYVQMREAEDNVAVAGDRSLLPWFIHGVLKTDSPKAWVQFLNTIVLWAAFLVVPSSIVLFVLLPFVFGGVKAIWWKPVKGAFWLMLILIMALYWI